MSDNRSNGGSGLGALKRVSAAPVVSLDEAERQLGVGGQPAAVEPAVAPTEKEKYEPIVLGGIQKILAKEEPPEYAPGFLNTRIPQWLKTELDDITTRHKLTIQEVVANALMEYLGVRPPHERKGKR